MSTPNERSNILVVKQESSEQPEPFAPPTAISDLASLTDGRGQGEYKSIYPRWAWFQIVIELMYLVCVLLISMILLFFIARHVTLKESGTFASIILGDYPLNIQMVTWASVGLAGACGGCSSALKWLYHGVAKQRWHRDRIVWRLVVPIQSAVLALFAGLMVISGIVPFLSKTPLASPATGAAFGFFVGFFSDNVLAALQNLAFKTFGTVDKRPGPDKMD